MAITGPKLLIAFFAASLIGCGNADRLTEFRLAPALGPASGSSSQAERDRVRKRLAEVGEALGLEEKTGEPVPGTFADFVQPVKRGWVEVRAYTEGERIVVEVSQRKPTSSSAVLFAKASALVGDRLRTDFTGRVSETGTPPSMWSIIRSEDAAHRYP